MKRITLFFIALILLVVSSTTAANSSSGLIKGIVVEGGACHFHAGDHTAYYPGTSKNESWGDWTFSLSSYTGRAWYALLLQAKSEGKKVYVTGAGNNDVWGDRETVRILRVVD